MENEEKSRKLFRLPLLELTDSAGFDFNRQMQLISERYAAENRLLAAVKSGDPKQVFSAYRAYGELMQDPLQENARTSEDPLRDFKNSVLITNTLFRKAIEGSDVHPVYIHEYSSYFGLRIEAAGSMEELHLLIRDMVYVYCGLVKECSLAGYSPSVQKALLFIDMNLAAPISTRDIAGELFLTPNYLSGRFKQETGVSISEYLLNRRVRLACQLLGTTELSVQVIAAKTGMGDASYFSKQFKKVMGRPPLKYRRIMRESAE
ncbi:MAG: helix-turn-helix domain-containing protein [Lachnospiraceae bacterium]|nr:helix-turn-helix domain-containing protein [Lachnospiraceae bacterium]